MAKINPRFLGEDEIQVSSLRVTVDEATTTKLTGAADRDFEFDPRRKVAREINIKRELLDLYRKESDISKVYRETLRSMIHLFGDLFIIDSDDNIKKVDCMHGNQERVIAKLKQESNIILPVITVTQTTSDNDEKRNKFTPLLVNERYWDSDKHRAYRVLSFIPRPVNINYSINFWCKYLADIDQLLEQSRLKFNPDATISTPFSTKTKAYIVEEVNNSELSPGDTAERIIRKTLNISVEAYIPSPKFVFTSTGKVDKFTSTFDLY